MNLQIGRQVKNYRKSCGFTLNNLSEKTGLSVSYLSMLERGMNSPTIENLNKICHALNITLSSLIEKASASSSIVTHRNNRRVIFDDGGISYTAATEGEFQMSCIELIVSDDKLHISHGHVADEVGYIASGSVLMTVGNADYTLEAGDCIYIEANQPHSYHKLSEEPCITFWTYSSSTHHTEEIE